MTDTRLTPETLPTALAREGVRGPAVDPDSLSIGIVHIGIGAFHRAHQAVFTELAAAASGDTRWGILGVTQRSRGVVDQLEPQGGLYGVLQKGADETELRVVGSVRGVAFPGEDTPRVIDAIAAETTHIVSLTVTEKGYRARADGSLDRADADLLADAGALAAVLGGADDVPPARSPIGLLVRGIAARAAASSGPLTVVCCDNMVDNGRVVERLVAEVLDLAGAPDDVRRWVEENVAFPNTMVDRIVPATTEENRVEAEGLTGLRDEGLVVAEPFRQWVIEDRFAGPRPPWELAGATLTSDVTPFERAKLRMLNGTHSLLAYLGSLADLPLISDAVADPRIGAIARGFLAEDAVPTLEAPDGLELSAYSDSLIERFSNPNTRHTTIQVAMDGSKKLPIRLLGTIADRLAAGARPRYAARALAAWAVFVARGRSRAGRELVLDDPRAVELAEAAGRGAEPLGAERLVANLFALEDLVPAAVSGHPEFAERVAREADALLTWLDGGDLADVAP